MARFHLRLQPGSPDFEAAAAQMRARIDELKRRLAATGEGGDATSRERHRARGKLLVRDRVRTLLDIAPGPVPYNISESARVRSSTVMERCARTRSISLPLMATSVASRTSTSE